MPKKTSTSGVLTHAIRDLRGGIRHLRLLLVCLSLGVAVMSCIGSMIDGVRGGVDRDAKSLLGGDIEIRQLYQPIPALPYAWLQFHTQSVSQISEMRAMAENLPQNGGERTLIELKGIDAAYPLFGALTLEDGQGHPVERQKVFANNVEKEMFGAAVDSSLLDMLHLKVGQYFRLGRAIFQIRALIAEEPDRSVGVLSLGPRVMVSNDAIPETGLLAFGSLISYRYRAALPPHADLAAWKRELAAAFPNAYWNLRDWHESAPGLMTLIDRLALFFALTGITALIVAGIGIGNAAGVYMWSKRDTIATMKCLGASRRHVRRVYLIQLLIAGSAAIVCGLLVGTIGEYLLLNWFGDLLPVRGERGIYLLPLLYSAGLGYLTLLLFSLLPLAQLDKVKPAALFRGSTDISPSPSGGRGRKAPDEGLSTHLVSERPPAWRGPHPDPLPKGEGAYAILLIAAMSALAMLFTGTVKIPLYFTGGLILSLGIFFGISTLLRRFALARAHGHYRLTLSMALANIARPGAATASMVAALGIGMTLLIALALVGGNLRRQIEEGLPEHAPAFFLVDIQPSERDALLGALKTLPQIGQIDDLPMVRGRIIKLNGVPVDKLSIDANAKWALQGDRGLTWSAAQPPNAPVVRGKWWPRDYHGAPLVSFDASLASGMGLKVGDTITIAALDKEITATIANLRDIRWGTMEMNFAIVLSPGALDGLPATYIATVGTPPQGEAAVQAMLAKDYPDVAVVRVREALGKIAQMLGRISNAVLAVAGVTIACGILVMASAIHAALHKRVFDTVMLKVLGVTRRRILRIYLTEFALIALAAAGASAIIGTLAGWGVMQLMIFSEFIPMPSVILGTLASSLLLAIGLGLAATHATLGVKPLSLLRNE